MSPVWPAPLAPGGTIAVVSPASTPRDDRLERGRAALTALGYQVREYPHARCRWHFVAGTDAERLADLHAAFADPEIDAVWCSRGGYGSMRLLGSLDWDLLAANPKPFVGYSDITALQQAMAARLGWVTFSGPMVASGHGYGREGGIEPGTESDVWRWLRPTAAGQPLANADGSSFTVLRPGRAQGVLLGGNLSLFTALVGTPYLPVLDGAILAIEDVGEKPYAVDRMLLQLELAGVFDRIGALLIGDFAQYLTDGATGPAVEELVMERVGGRDLAVVSNVVHGHCDRRLTLPIGAQAELTADRHESAISVQCDRSTA
ncbi:MAG: LD-carboxypeptidase [Armatimonadetes bacterium]|nr:LD-carboxypeptidase [Armatimonadota bacterium]